MATKVPADKALADASGVERVWQANPDMKLGKNDDTVALAETHEKFPVDKGHQKV